MTALSLKRNIENLASGKMDLSDATLYLSTNVLHLVGTIARLSDITDIQIGKSIAHAASVTGETIASGAHTVAERIRGTQLYFSMNATQSVIGAEITHTASMGAQAISAKAHAAAEYIRSSSLIFATKSLVGTIAAGVSHFASMVAQTIGAKAHAIAEGIRSNALYVTIAALFGSVAAGAAHVASMVAQKVASAALTIVEWARAAAHFVANAIASMGLSVPIMLAAAGAVAGIYVVGKYSPFSKGGIAMSPTLALIGEKEPEAVIPLSKVAETIIAPFTERNLNYLNILPLLPIPMATGGIAYKETLAMIGEREAEAVIPLSQMTTRSNTVTVNVYETSSPKATSEEIIRTLRREGIIE